MYQFNGAVGLILSSMMLQCFPWKCNSNVTFSKVEILFILLSIMCSIGILIIFFLPSVKNLTNKKRESDGTVYESLRDDEYNKIDNNNNDENISGFDVLFQIYNDNFILLLIPTIFFNGYMLAFLFGDYTGDIIRPVLGTGN